MEVTEKRVLESLRIVEDPDLHKNIVDLGFVKNIKICGGVVALDIQLTTPACPVKEQLKSQAEEAIRGVPGVEGVNINMTADVTRGFAPTGDLLKSVKNVVAVGSGKGGVGKSTVSVGIAVALAMDGASTGLMDLDCWGPNIPLMMGIDKDKEPLKADKDKNLIPYERYGVKVMSLGVLLEKPEDPVIWRGPMVHHLIRQFCGQVTWGELDYLVIDLPPGTGDVQLSLTQLIPLTGAIIVSTPQDVALMDAGKAINMFGKVKTPILGMIENMSFFECPHCGKETDIFGRGGAKKAAETKGITFLGSIPIDVDVRIGGDTGEPILVKKPDSVAARMFREAARNLAAKVSTQNATRKREGQFGVPVAWGKPS